MVAIRQKLLHSINSLIVVMISLLGFTTSCEDDEPVLMYGTPHADFIISGKIVSATDSELIQDIIVEMRYVPEKIEDPIQSRLISTGFSNGIGSYYITSRGNPQEQTFQLRFIDTDGALNGQYQTLDTTVVFQDPKFVKGDGSWYAGYVEKKLDIKLMPKE